MKYVIIIAVALFLVYNVARLIITIVEKRKQRKKEQKGGDENAPESEISKKEDNK